MPEILTSPPASSESETPISPDLRRLKGFKSKCERLGLWPGKVQDFYDQRKRALRKDFTGDNTPTRDADRAAWAETKHKFGAEVLAKLDALEKAENTPEAIYAREIKKLAENVDPNKTAGRWAVKQWALNRLDIRPDKLDIETAPTRGAVIFLAACYETPRIREKLFEELIRGTGQSDPKEKAAEDEREAVADGVDLVDLIDRYGK